MLDGAKLSWIETEDTPHIYEDGTPGALIIKPTGRVETFDVHFSPAGLMDARARIIKSAHEIEVAWASHETKEWVTSF